MKQTQSPLSINQPSNNVRHVVSRRLKNIISFLLSSFNSYVAHLAKSPYFFIYFFLFNLQYPARNIYLPFKHVFSIVFSFTKDVNRVLVFTVLLDILLSFGIKSHRVQTAIKIPVLLSAFAIFGISFFVLLTYRILPTYDIIAAAAHSHISEFFDYAREFLLHPQFFLAIAAGIGALLLVYYLCAKLLKCTNFVRVVLLVMLIDGIFSTPSGLRPISFGRLLYLIPPAVQDYRLSSAFQIHVTEPPAAAVTLTGERLPLVVLLLGESTSRRQLSIYNTTGLPTTPNLRRLQQNEELIVYSDVVAPHAYTPYAIRSMLTFDRWETPNRWATSDHLVNILNAAGYDTHFYSTHDAADNIFNIARGFARASQHYKFLTPPPGAVDPPYDEGLVTLLKNSLEEEGRDNTPTFYILHLMGCHYSYDRRYPNTMENLFTAADEPANFTEKQRRKLAEYHNAVLYGDIVVEQTLKLLEDKDAIVLYLSDHGEEVYDTPSRPFQGHYQDGATAPMVEVPFVVWTSQTFRNKRPEMYTDMYKNKEQPYMTDDLIHSMLDIMHVSTKDVNLGRSIFNPAYNPIRKRITAGVLYSPF